METQTNSACHAVAAETTRVMHANAKKGAANLQGRALSLSHTHSHSHTLSLSLTARATPWRRRPRG